MGCFFGVVYVCMFTASNALLMSSATVTVRSGVFLKIYLNQQNYIQNSRHERH